MLWQVFRNSLILTKIYKAVKTTKMPFYAVAKGRTAGIFMTWTDCEAQVKGFPGARYKKFNTVDDAQHFITTEGSNKEPKAKFSKSRISLPIQPSTSNLKRSFNTSSQYSSKNEPNIQKKKTKSKPKSSSEDDSSDDLKSIIVKQMDDIEKRLKGFEKGVDKIIKKSVKTERKAKLIEPQNLITNSVVKDSNVNDFEIDEDGYVQVYTDGACSANGRNGAKAGLGVYWGQGHTLNISAPVSGRATNNCGEIQAATRAIQLAIDHGVDKLTINTDSKFLINSVTKWMHGWKRKGWKLQSGEPVKNERDFKDLDEIQDKIQIKWNYVEAHRGIHGNEMADQLAKAGAAMYTKLQ